MPAFINNEQDRIEVTPELEATVAKAVSVALVEEGVSVENEVSVVFIDNAYIQQLNRDYRHKDCATDVLSFALTEQGEGEPEITGAETEEILGDIFISLEKAREQAEEYGHSLNREVVYLAVHGVLHLVGYDHENEDDKKEMRRHEEQVMAALNLTR